MQFNEIQQLVLLRLGISKEDVQNISFNTFERIYVEFDIAYCHFMYFAEYQDQLLTEINNELNLIAQEGIDPLEANTLRLSYFIRDLSQLPNSFPQLLQYCKFTYREISCGISILSHQQRKLKEEIMRIKDKKERMSHISNEDRALQRVFDIDRIELREIQMNQQYKEVLDQKTAEAVKRKNQQLEQISEKARLKAENVMQRLQNAEEQAELIKQKEELAQQQHIIKFFETSICYQNPLTQQFYERDLEAIKQQRVTRMVSAKQTIKNKQKADIQHRDEMLINLEEINRQQYSKLLSVQNSKIQQIKDHNKTREKLLNQARSIAQTQKEQLLNASKLFIQQQMYNDSVNQLPFSQKLELRLSGENSTVSLKREIIPVQYQPKISSLPIKHKHNDFQLRTQNKLQSEYKRLDKEKEAKLEYAKQQEQLHFLKHSLESCRPGSALYKRTQLQISKLE
ncbi:Hypothetical_protein [Hexamita inflata]|uniref:Hypothetical_protein n=1 Tax=Hexamita inflata TaxID=28002 RepID=A0AA86TGG0_9EUKA|nr:Hypothetical protein HINF_LOCUS3107 [Hexamita inflata]